MHIEIHEVHFALWTFLMRLDAQYKCLGTHMLTGLSVSVYPIGDLLVDLFSPRSVVISWSNMKQPIVSLLSTKIEYRDAAMIACEIP